MASDIAAARLKKQQERVEILESVLQDAKNKLLDERLRYIKDTWNVELGATVMAKPPGESELDLYIVNKISWVKGGYKPSLVGCRRRPSTISPPEWESTQTNLHGDWESAQPMNIPDTPFPLGLK